MVFSTGGGILLALWLVRRAGWLPVTRGVRRELTWRVFQQDGSYFLSFALTTMITGLATSGTILAIRATIASQQGLEAAGIFDVAWTLSMMYITIALSSFSTYYLPTFAQTKSNQQRNELIHKILRLTILILVPVITSVLLLKSVIIQLLYSEQFLGSLSIIRWMLIGDYFKATSWVFGVTITASADKRTLLVTELLWNAGFLSLSIISLTVFKSLEGIGIAFIIPYIFYLFYNMFYAYKRFGYLASRSIILKWFLGAGIVFVISALTWADQHVNWWVILLGIFLVAFNFSVSLNRSDYSNIAALLRQKLQPVPKKLL
jgi:O-antigen/teichoic acid export membrane protein